MSLHYMDTTLSPMEHDALHDVVEHMRRELEERRQEAIDQSREMTSTERRLYDSAYRAHLWLAAQAERLYEEWQALPPGSHLRDAYADRVWTWSDRDLAAMDEVFAQPRGPVREGLDGPEVYCTPEHHDQPQPVRPRAGRRAGRRPAREA